MGPGVGAVMTTRRWVGAGGSTAPYDAFNLGSHVGDRLDDVLANRAALAGLTEAGAVWMQQVHGHDVLRLTAGDAGRVDEPVADGALTTEPGVVCTAMVADCLPVLVAAPDARGVAALHAGWRGLAGAGVMAGRGILETGVAALCEAASVDPVDLRVWLGPCIGPNAFEVGADVLIGFGADPAEPHARFKPVRGADGVPRWLADLPGLARDRLAVLGVQQVSGGALCTVSDSSRFFSYRRERVTGRQAACIWLLD